LIPLLYKRYDASKMKVETEFIDGTWKTIDVVTTPKDVIELVLSYFKKSLRVFKRQHGAI
ncbi:MAG: hypothetical protein RSE55_02930, partial [Lachnospiraceae bacterium]